MVEQIRISPEEVRGYGNICEGHTLEDFIVSNSGLTKEKENVHGALTSVYKLIYSLYGLMFDFDKGNKQLYLQMAEADTLSFGFDTVNKQLYLVDEAGTGLSLGFDEDTNELYISDDAPPIVHNYSLAFSSSSYVATGGSAEVSVTLLDDNVAVTGATVSFTGGTSTVTGVTNSSGVATATVSVSATSTITATYQNVTDTCTITVPSAYIINDDATTDNSSTLFGSSISLRNNGTATTSYVSASPPYYIIKNTRGSAEAFVPYTDLEGITDSFKLSIESAMHSTSNVCLIGLYYYQDSNNWGGVKAVNTEQWISSKTNGTFTEQQYQTGQSVSTTKIRTEMVFDSSANTLTISTYNINNDTLIQTKTMNIPITLDSSVKWGTTTTWNINAQHDVYNIKAEYI